MKKTSFLLLTIAIVLNCYGQIKKQDTFEGTITYKITLSTKTDNTNYNEYQKQKYGDKVKISISKNGSFKREYLSSGPKGFVFSIYNSSTNKTYTKWRNIDTTYSSSCSENSLSFISEKDLPAENIYGQLCQGYFISGVDARSGQPVALTYFYPKDKEYINPGLYKNYKDWFYNKVIEKLKAPFYKLIMDMGKYTVTFEIEKIERGSVNSDIINLPANVPIK